MVVLLLYLLLPLGYISRVFVLFLHEAVGVQIDLRLVKLVFVERFLRRVLLLLLLIYLLLVIS